ncbi:MAG: GNAT family N-acetyltransferase, partial [Candidatus Riflebacteria bacterium]|nr:GNAT family N-acetyltransferase [Candidatus Riflebacteria bacterium]
MDVRLATARDAGHLIAAYMKHVNPSRREGDRFARLHLTFERCLLAEQEGMVLGGLTWGLRDDPRSGLAQLTGLLVNERVRRKGLGTLLVLLAIEDMHAFFAGRGCRLRRVFLTADQQNLPVRRMWEKLGFGAVAQLEDHVKPGRTDLIYA